MWWTKDVTSAIHECKAQNSVFVILVEPPESIMKPENHNQQPSVEMLSRLATSNMHSRTFSNPIVLSTIQASKAVPMKFPCDMKNADFAAFSVYFKIQESAPNTYFISPHTGETIIQKKGFLSPKNFTADLITATKAVSGRHIQFPDFPTSQQPHVSPTQTSETSTKDIQQPASSEKMDQVDEEPRETTALKPSSTEKTKLMGTSSKSMKLPSPTIVSSPESRLLARLPNGDQVRRSFPSNTTFSSVRNWLSEQTNLPTTSLRIFTAFPRHVFDLAADAKMLSELGLVPSETLVVARCVEEESDGSGQGSGASVSVVRSIANGAFTFVGGFFRSLVPRTTDGTGEENGDGTNGMTAARMPAAVTMERTERQRSVEEDDENLLSNGNSTQYGWNPDDNED